MKKEDYHRIETIQENDIINIDNTISDSTAIHDKTNNKDITTGDVLETTIGRAKRETSRKAVINIKKQQSISLATKLQRLLTLDSNINRKRGSRSKKRKSAGSSSDEETTQGPTKHSKTEESVLNETISRKIVGSSQIHSQDHLSIRKDAIQLGKLEPLKSSMTTRNSNRNRTFSQSENTKMQQLKEENESFPEVKKFKANIKKQEIKKRRKRQNRSMTSSENEIQPSSKEKNTKLQDFRKEETRISQMLYSIDMARYL